MNRLLVCVLSLAFCLAIASSELLCTPDQWEGYEGSTGGYVYHSHAGLIREWMKVSYDAKNHFKAAFINYVNNDYENKFQMVLRHGDDGDDSGRVYIVNLKTDKCWSKKVEGPFKKACIPADAKRFGDHYMGLKDKGLLVSMYFASVKGVTVILSVNKQGNVIIPVGETVFGEVMKSSFIQPAGFLDITPGIRNATVFDIPKQCQKQEDTSPAEYFLKEHTIFGF